MKRQNFNFGVQDEWGKPYVQVHNIVIADPHFTAAEKIVYIGLRTFAHCTNGIYPSMSKL